MGVGEEGFEPGASTATAEMEWLAAELAGFSDGKSVHQRRRLYHSAIVFIDNVRSRGGPEAREFSDADLARYRRLLQALRDTLRRDRR